MLKARRDKAGVDPRWMQRPPPANPNCRGIRPNQGWSAHLAGRHLLSGHLAEWLDREQVVVGASEVRGGNQGQPAHVALHGEWVGR